MTFRSLEVVMFWDNLKSVCDEKGIRVTPLLEELDIGTSALHRWQNGGNVNSNILIKIADKLGVSTDLLLYGKEKTSHASDEQNVFSGATQEDLDMFRLYMSLPQQSKLLCRTYIKASHDQVTALTGGLSNLA